MPLGLIPSNTRPFARSITVATTTEQCPHYTRTSASNACSVPAPSLGGPTSPLMCVRTTKAVRAIFPVHIASTAPTDTTTWSHTSSRSIKSSTLRKNTYLGRALSSQLTDGTHLGPYRHSTMMHSLYSLQLHLLLHLLRLRTL